MFVRLELGLLALCRKMDRSRARVGASFEEKLVRVLDLHDHVLRGNVMSVARVLCSSLGKDEST